MRKRLRLALSAVRASVQQETAAAVRLVEKVKYYQTVISFSFWRSENFCSKISEMERKLIFPPSCFCVFVLEKLV